ncbi:MAG: response regulator [Terriglobales bacterium]|jgi:DNA-binding response OmpR family regulator
MPERDRLPAVLIVDDNRSVADSLVLVLQNNGFQASASYSAQEALSTADRQQPDVAVIEVVLPDLDGIRLARRIQVLSSRTHILLMSGCPDAARLVETCEFEVLAKPIALEKLMAKMREMIATGCERNHERHAAREAADLVKGGALISFH